MSSFATMLAAAATETVYYDNMGVCYAVTADSSDITYLKGVATKQGITVNTDKCKGKEVKADCGTTHGYHWCATKEGADFGEIIQLEAVSADETWAAADMCHAQYDMGCVQFAGKIVGEKKT